MRTQLSAGVFAGEAPGTRRATPVRPSGPRAGLPLERPELIDALGAEALPGREIECDLGSVQQAAVPGRVVHRRPCPEWCAIYRAEVIEQRLLAVGVEIVERQMNGPRLRVGLDHAAHHAREGGGRPIRRGTREVTAGFGFDDAEDVGGAAAAVYASDSGFCCRLGLIPAGVSSPLSRSSVSPRRQ